MVKTGLMDISNDLLAGVLTVRLGLAEANDVALRLEDPNRKGSLTESLLQSGAIDEKTCNHIDIFTEETLILHDGDVEKALSKMGGDRIVYDTFGPSASQILENSSDLDNKKEAFLQAQKESLLATPETPGRYKLSGGSVEASEIGRGGLGRVLIAFDVHLERDVAIKELITPEEDASETEVIGAPQDQEMLTKTIDTVRVSRFLREARITGSLEHPSIVPVYEIGRRDDGNYYYSMKLVRGKTLAQMLHECENIHDRLELLPHFADLCQAIAYAHSKKVIHRDIKPANVMLGEFGETVVLDWGLAKVHGQPDYTDHTFEQETKSLLEAMAGRTIMGSAIGTPSYMSPEQAMGQLDQIDERSDIWCLGVVLYQILTGRTPFEGSSPMEIVQKVKEQPIKPVRELCPEAPPDLAAVAEKALHRNKLERYSEAREIANEVQAYMSGSKIKAYEYNSWELLTRFVAKNKSLTISAILFVLLLVVGAGVIFDAYHKAEISREEAVAAREEAENNERSVHYHLSQSLLEKAKNFFTEKDYLQARVFAAEALLNNPYNPYSPYAFAPDVTDTVEAAESLVSSSSLAFQADANAFVIHDTTLLGHEADVNDVEFSPDGLWLVSAGTDASIKIWNVLERKLYKTISGHKGKIWRLAFSPDGKTVASCSDDQTVRIWSIPDGKELHVLRNNSSQVFNVTYSPDGKWLAAGQSDSRATIWDLSSMKIVKSHEQSRGRVGAIAFSNDSKWLATAGSDRIIRLYRMKDHKLIHSLNGHKDQIHEITFAPDGEHMVSTGSDKIVNIWNIKSMQLEESLVGHEDPIWSARFSSDGKRLITSSDDHTIRMWDFEKRKHIMTITAHGHYIPIAVFSPDDSLIASASWDKTIKLWKVLPPRVTRLSGHEKYVYSVDLSPNEKHLVSIGMEQTMNLWDFNAKTWIKKCENDDVFLVSMNHSADGKWLVTGNGSGGIGLWDAENGYKRILTKQVHEKRRIVWWTTFSPDSRLVASCCEKEVKILHANDLSLVTTLHGHSEQVWYATFSSDGKLLATASNDKTVKLWDTATWQPLMTYKGHTDWVTVVEFSPDGHRLASGSRDKTVKIWETYSGKLLTTLEGHKEWVPRVMFMPDGVHLLSTSDDHTIRLWNINTGKVVQQLLFSYETVARARTSDGRFLITNDFNDIVIYPVDFDFWKQDPAFLVEQVKQEAGMAL